MPVPCEANPRSSPGALDNPQHIVICRVGLGLSGPFKKAPGGFTHLLIAVDKFTKWVKVRPLTKIGSKQVVNFL
jgi:hypothetical protein